MAEALEGLTGRVALRNPHNGLAEQAVELATSFGVPATLAAFQRAATALEHPDAGQIVFGAARLLRPIPSARDIAQREEARREAKTSDKARSATRELLEERARWDDEPSLKDTLQRPAGRVYSGPQRVGEVIARHGPQVHTEGSS